jgi:hypothetical protein
MRLKPHYRRYDHRRGWGYQPRRSQFRPVRTFQEIRSNMMDRSDACDGFWSLRIRGNRSQPVLDARNDFPISKAWKKSWKDFTRQKKQWG